MEIWKSFKGFFKKDGPRGDRNDGPKSLDVIRNEARKNSMDWLANKPSEYAQELRLNETVSKLRTLAFYINVLTKSEPKQPEQSGQLPPLTHEQAASRLVELANAFKDQGDGSDEGGKGNKEGSGAPKLSKLASVPGLEKTVKEISVLLAKIPQDVPLLKSTKDNVLNQLAKELQEKASELQKQAPTLEKEAEKEVSKLKKEVSKLEEEVKTASAEVKTVELEAKQTELADKLQKLEAEQKKFQKPGRDAKDALEWLAEIQTEIDLGLLSNDKEPPSLAQHLGFADDKNDATGKEKNEPATKISLDGRKDGLRVYKEEDNNTYHVTKENKDNEAGYTCIEDVKVILSLGEKLKWDLPKIQVVRTKQEYDIEMKKKVWGIVDGGRKKNVLFTDKQEEASRLIEKGGWEDINYVSAAKENVTKEDGAEKIKKLDIESLKTSLCTELNQKLADIKISDVQYASKVKTDIKISRDAVKIYKAGDIYIASCGDLSGDVYRKRDGQIMKLAVGAERSEGVTKLEQFNEVSIDDTVSPDQVQWILPPLKVVQQNSEFILTNRNIENEKEIFSKILTGTVGQIKDQAKLLLENACDQAHNAVEQKIKEQKENLCNKLEGIWEGVISPDTSQGSEIPLKTLLGVGEYVKVNFTVDPNMANSGIKFYQEVGNDGQIKSDGQIYVSSRSELNKNNAIQINSSGSIRTGVEVTDNSYKKLTAMDRPPEVSDPDAVKWILPQLHVLVKLEDNNVKGDSGNKSLEVVLTDNEYACNMKEYKGYGEIAKTVVFAGALDQMKQKAEEVLKEAPEYIIEHARALNKFTEDVSRGFRSKVLQEAYDPNMTDQDFRNSLNLYTDINRIKFEGGLTVEEFFDEKKEINSLMIDNCKTSFLEIISKCASLDPIYKQLRDGITFDSINNFKAKCGWKLENATAEGMNCLLDSMRKLYAPNNIDDDTFLGKLSRRSFEEVRTGISGRLDEKMKTSIQAIKDNVSRIETDQSFSEDNKKSVINAVETLVGSTGQTGSTVLKDIAKQCCDQVENEDNMENEISQAIINRIRESAQSIDNLLSEHKVDFSELSMLLKSQYDVVNNKMLNLGHPDGKALLELLYGDERVKGNGLLLYTWSENDDKQGGKIRCSEMKKSADGKETKAVFLNQQSYHFSPMEKVRQALQS